MSFAIGLLNGLAGAADRRNEKAERSREMSILEALANGRASQQAPGAGQSAGQSSQQTASPAAFSYDGKISDRPAHAFQRFVSAGLPDHVAAGLVGNLMQESGPDINPAAVGDNGNAYGAGQWNGPRRHAYLGFASQRGVDPSDFDTQIDFLLHEGQTSEKDAWGRIMAAKTAEEAAILGSNHFWRPGAPHNENRAAYARRVFETRPVAEAPAAPAATQKDTGQSWRWFQNRMKGGAQ